MTKTVKYLSSKEFLIWSFFVIMVALGAFYIGYIQDNGSFEHYIKETKPLRIKTTKYKYISPLVGVNAPDVFDLGYYPDTKKKIEDIVESYQAKGLVDYSIYYRNLNSNVTFGFNEESLFSPASLLKIPIALAAYRQDEEKPGFLDTQATFTQAMADISKKRGDDPTKFVVGQKYVLRNLVEQMLVNSDNSARDLIISSLSMDYIYELYEYLGLKDPDQDTSFRISVENYALFFRMLYSSTFVSEAHSEELLTILTKTTFQYGIKKGLPGDSAISVAHKYGVYNAPAGATGVALQSLHDCGIVYDDNDAYLICIMTKGPDQNVLAQFISDISKVVYDFTEKEIY